MSNATEQIRVSEPVKREFERRMGEGESYDDVLERLFSADRELLAGFGRWSAETAERARETREAYKERSKEGMRRRTEDG